MFARLIPDRLFSTDSRAFYCFFKNVLGYIPLRRGLYDIAFTHKSASHQQGKGHRINNERLEFLGDAVLSAVVADYLYHRYPNRGEGFLTVLRSKIVSRNNLNRLGNTIGLSHLIRYDHRCNGEFKCKDGDGIEALIGAIYLDKGYRFTRRIIIDRFIGMYMDVDRLEQEEWNYKSKLLDWGQQNKRSVSFELVKTTFQGSRSKPQYEVAASIDGVPRQHAVSGSIKSAEQLAAEKTFKLLVQNRSSAE